MLPEVFICAILTAAACNSVKAASMAAAIAAVSPKVWRTQAATSDTPPIMAAISTACDSLKALWPPSSSTSAWPLALRSPKAAFTTSTSTAAPMGQASDISSSGDAAHTTASSSSSEARFARMAAELAAISTLESALARAPKLAVAAVDEAKPAKKPATASPQRAPTMRRATWPSMPVPITSTTIFQIVRGRSTPQGSSASVGSSGITTSAAASSSRPSLISCSVMILRLRFLSWRLACSSAAAVTPSAVASTWSV